jgi:hypothetical protein
LVQEIGIWPKPTFPIKVPSQFLVKMHPRITAVRSDHFDFVLKLTLLCREKLWDNFIGLDDSAQRKN